VTLPPFAAERRHLQHGARNYRSLSAANAGAQQQTRSPLLLSIDGTDRQFLKSVAAATTAFSTACKSYSAADGPLQQRTARSLLRSETPAQNQFRPNHPITAQD